MQAVDSSVILRGNVEIDAAVSIGPYCVLDATLGPIRVRDGTKLIGNVYVYGPVDIGRDNTIYPFSCIGFAPQSYAFDPSVGGRGVRIGDRNVLRESVTIHRAQTDDGPTTIGNDNYLMSNVHVGHDVQMADRASLASGAVLGGHVRVDERVIIGGVSGLHQFVRLGRGSMIGGGCALSSDLLPYFMLTGSDCAGSINIVGMRRQGLGHEFIDHVRWIYKTLYRRGHTIERAVDVLRERVEVPIVAECIEFIETSRRGICKAEPQAKRKPS